MEALSGHHGHGLASHAIGFGLIGVLVVLAILAVVVISSPRYRRPVGKGVAWVAGSLLGLYLVLRGIVEFFIIHYNDPASYHDSWGGPSLAGVFLVHSGPGFLVLVAVAVLITRKVRSRRAPVPSSGPRRTTPARGR